MTVTFLFRRGDVHFCKKRGRPVSFAIPSNWQILGNRPDIIPADSKNELLKAQISLFIMMRIVYLIFTLTFNAIKGRVNCKSEAQIFSAKNRVKPNVHFCNKSSHTLVFGADKTKPLPKAA